MKKWLFALLILSLLAAVLIGNLTTQAAPVDRFRREQATASFSSTVGCIRTTVDVFAIGGSDQHATNTANTQDDAHVTLNQLDTCKGREVLHAEGHTPLQSSDMNIDSNLNSATLTATVPLIEEDSNQRFDVAVHLTWTGNGGVGHATGPIRVPGSRNTIPTSIQGRIGSAYGTITRDGVNLAPEHSTFARLGQAQDSASSRN